MKRRGKKEKEQCEHQEKLRNLKINNNRLLIEIKKQKQENFALQNSLDKTTKDMRNNKVVMIGQFG